MSAARTVLVLFLQRIHLWNKDCVVNCQKVTVNVTRSHKPTWKVFSSLLLFVLITRLFHLLTLSCHCWIGSRCLQMLLSYMIPSCFLTHPPILSPSSPLPSPPLYGATLTFWCRIHRAPVCIFAITCTIQVFSLVSLTASDLKIRH